MPIAVTTPSGSRRFPTIGSDAEATLIAGDSRKGRHGETTERDSKLRAQKTVFPAEPSLRECTPQRIPQTTTFEGCLLNARHGPKCDPDHIAMSAGMRVNF